MMGYSYYKDKSQWFPDGNCGLHYTNSAEAYGSMGAYFQKSKMYKVKPMKEIEVNCINMYESLCTIKKPYVQHWLLKDLPLSFKVTKKNKWDAHPVNIQKDCINNVGTNYVVLGETDRGPQIIEHKSTIALQCHFDINYEESVIILRNYIAKKAADIRYRKDSCVNLDEAYLKSKQPPTKFDEDSNPKNMQIPRSTTSMKENSPDKDSIRPQTMRFLHSGLNYSKRRGELIVHNNAFGSFVKLTPEVMPHTTNVTRSTIAINESHSSFRPETSYNSRFQTAVGTRSKHKSRTSGINETSNSLYESMIKKTIHNTSQFDKQESILFH
jgi:hypothetical protein